jgi:hypothetical protein
MSSSRREFIRQLGCSSLALPFVANLPSLFDNNSSNAPKRKRLVVMFTPNGTVKKNFWPGSDGPDLEFKEITKPIESYRDQILLIHGLSNKLRGDGDSHMRGMGCLLTGIELAPGNIQGGSDTPAGWAGGISIDQEIKNFLQSNPETETFFGSLEFGVQVPERADPWTRLVYAGKNKPIPPISDPYQMFKKMYGGGKEQETLQSVLDEVQSELKLLKSNLSAEDARRIEEHSDQLRQLESEIQRSREQQKDLSPPELEQGVVLRNDNMPKLSQMQIDLMVNGFSNDMNRVATIQYTNSVGQAKMRWEGVEQGHHGLSHDPDENEQSQEKLTKINRWFCEQLAYLIKRLGETKDSATGESLLSQTTIVWTNELGHGNSHSLNNIPFLLVGPGLGYKLGRYLKLDNQPHNRLLMSLAKSFGHELKTFGKPELCQGGVIEQLWA